MYRISDKNKNTKKVRWVLLEQLPTILSPKMLILVFLYAMAFTLLLLGLRILHFETSLSRNMTALTSTAGHANTSVLYHQEAPEAIQQGIASQIIRLHVIANSDTAEDQALKLKVRDAIIKSLQNSLSETDSIRDARRQIIAQIPQIRQKAQETIAREGYGYPVRVTLGNQYFPMKDYGDLRFPAGNYEALCVRIGSASGHNWWCVLFPSLCFVDETHAVVPDDSKEKLQDSLSPEEYESLEIHSAACDWITDKLR
ncbi:stage II sporulation protein R [Jutongia sp.]